MMHKEELHDADIQACIAHLNTLVQMTPENGTSPVNWTEMNKYKTLAEKSISQLETIFFSNPNLSKTEINDPVSCLYYYPRY